MTVGADLVWRLYGEPPERFTAARDRAVAEARARGDAAGAKEIAALRKPTIAAWLVNLLAIRRPELLADLAALAGEMRAAQRELRGAQLRELSAQRRRVVSSLVAEVRTLAGAAGVSTAKLPLNEVEDTLNAALSDEGIAASVRSGRLLRPVSYAGFGEVPRPRLRLVTAEPGAASEEDGPGRARPGETRTSRPRREEPKAGARRREAAREAEAAARRALERAEREALREREQADVDLAAAEDAERAAVAAIADLTERIAALQAERAEAEHEAGRRRLARRTAERAASAARRRHGDAAAALEAAGGTPGPFVEPAAPFADGGGRKAAARRGRADRGGATKAESGA
ncbi:hypothetical protein [Catenuloplanes atrovinosus]|uniref:Uncharacterized Zn finger protein (UPF0148 family) n=1 Tax=Catenuloplanes atrovinosus TaxID=137266 RepID=A0AAE3YWY2_9ACTN|nr:hypothetical protein [Catenuloplanes atrovinosus]MDR7280747.1 uncharacterized Zn finger protein (UPF0148 family) [Catenuloplanes atrovinosus]